MPENRPAQSNGAVYNQPVDDLEDAISRLKIGGNDDQESGGVANSCPYPERPGEPDCIFYLRTGMCGYGSYCKFNHPAAAGKGGQYRGELPERVGQPECGYYLKTGTCKYGSTCKYHHPWDRHGAGPFPLNILGLPMRQDEKPCPFYLRTGLCKFGAGCKFDHPQPASDGNILPIPGPATYGSTGSTILPSSGLPLVGGVSAVSLTRPPYLSTPPVQGPQGYMPIVVSPTQGVCHGWNTSLTGSLQAPEPRPLLGESSEIISVLEHFLNVALVTAFFFFFFLEFLLADDKRNGAFLVAFPCAFFLGLLSSIFAVLIAIDHMWRYAALEFAVVAMVIFLFHSLLHLKPLWEIAVSSVLGFSMSMSLNKLYTRYTARDFKFLKTQSPA